MKIDTTPDFLESVANHPRVYPYVSVKGCGYIRFGKIWDDCIAVVFDTGGWLFHRQDHNVYEVHTMFLPKSRDVNAKALRALGYMFDEAGADLIVTQIAGDLPHVRRLAVDHPRLHPRRVARGRARHGRRVDDGHEGL